MVIGDSMKVVALDPGGTTGICFASIDDRVVTLIPVERRLDSRGMHWYVESLINLHEPDFAIVYEDFQFRQGVRTGLDLTPAKLIGVIEIFEDTGMLYKQQPSIQGKKAFFNDERLKTLNAYWPHGKGHARSATKHLLYWLKFGAGALYVQDPTFVIAEK